MRRLALVVVAAASCFRGEFLAGTQCDDDEQCAPRYVCLKDGGTTSGGSTTGEGGVCGSPDYSPPPGTSSDTTGGPIDATSTGTGTTG